MTAAVKWLKRCIEKETEYVPCYIALCNCYLRLGKYELAEKMMDKGYNKLERESLLIDLKLRVARRFSSMKTKISSHNLEQAEKK